MSSASREGLGSRMARPPQKTISFFRIFVLNQARRQYVEDFQWSERLREIADLPLADRRLDGYIFDPREDDAAHGVLGIHAPIKTDFMTRIESHEGTVSDLLTGDGTTGSDFAHSTAVRFMPSGNAFALALGGANSPRTKAVELFLKKFVPLGPGASWAIEPLMDTDQLKRLREEAKGLVAFSTRFTTVRNLWTEDPADVGVVTMADQIADRLGGDVEIQITLKLASEARNNRSKKNLLDVVTRELPRLVRDKNSGTRVTALLEGGVEEELSLVAHRLAVTIDVSSEVSESRRFSSLITELRDVTGAMEDRVRSILEG